MSAEHLVTIYGTTVLLCAPDGLPVDSDSGTTELVGEAISRRAEVVVIPVERLTADFFHLPTGVAGEIAQKFDTYQLRVAVIGDIAEQVEASPELARWVSETNAGHQLWFLDDFADLQTRLDRRASPRPETS